MTDTPFDMPATGTWEQRGGWVCKTFAADYGLELFQAAGAVGNLGFESMGFKALQEIAPTVAGSRGGYGWGQWTASRRVAYEAFCKDEDMDPASDEANFAFFEEEMDTTHAYVLAHLRKARTIEDAVFNFGRFYEAPGGTTETHLPGYEGRLDRARRALAGAQA